MIKYGFIIALIFLNACSHGQIKYADKPIEHITWDELLREHVSSDGHVNYEGFIADSTKLNTYLNLLSNNHPKPATWAKNEQLAYWINAYNAFTVKLILNHYPLKSIKAIKTINIPFVNTPWHIKFFQLGGVDYNLDIIEHDILRKQYDEPRIHFAINCASKSCPDLRNEAYTADKIEKQLTEQAVTFINSPQKNSISPSQVELSKLFSWFKADFTKQGSLIEYINKYSNIMVTHGAKIKYKKYDWRLNN